MATTTFLLLALALWRISAMLVYEDGPFFCFRRLRKFVRAGEFGGDTIDANRLSPEELEEIMRAGGRRRGFLGELLSCLWCTSVWVALLIGLLYLFVPSSIYLWGLLALSSLAIFMDTLNKATLRLGREE